jgi:hypothetical protein
MRDRLWLNERFTRSDLIKTYTEGLAEAKTKFDNGETLAPGEPMTVSTPEWWQQEGITNDKLLGQCLASNESAEYCREGLDKRMAAPLNNWRGRANWQGGVFLAPRLLLVSEGELFSDHRYPDDLFFARNYQESLTQFNRAQSFSKIKLRSHLDTRNFYIGVGSSFGDHMNLEGRYAGQQIPLSLKIQSRLYPIFGEQFPLKLYGQADFENLKISQNDALEAKSTLSGVKEELSLGSGNWQRSRLRFVAPLMSRQIVKVNHFTDLEVRTISHDGLSEKNSSIGSWKTGFKFSLPIDGELELPSYFQSDELDADGMSKKKNLRHEMNWDMTVSLRPVVVRSGQYGQAYNVVGSEGQPTNISKKLTYFASDQKRLPSDNKFILAGEVMTPEQKLIFSTQHSWSLFDKGLVLIPAEKTEKENTDEQQSIKSIDEIARQELMYSIDRDITNTDDMFKKDQWFINRYKTAETHLIRPLTFSANISYDFISEVLRNDQKMIVTEQKRKNRIVKEQADAILAGDPDDPEVKKQAEEFQSQNSVKIISLAEPWSTFNTNTRLVLNKWSFSSKVYYNLYQGKASTAVLGLGLPPFFKSGLNLGFVLENSSVPDGYGGYVDAITKTRSVSLSSRLIPSLVSTIVVSDKTVPNHPIRDENWDHFYNRNYQSALGLSYNAPSTCWGMSFTRTKKYGQKEQDAAYILRLVVNFAGQKRSLPNVAQSMVRELPIGPENK